MSSQETPQARRFPIEAGDSPSLAAGLNLWLCTALLGNRTNPSLSLRRQLRRCPGCHCLTLPNVPIDVYIAMACPGQEMH
uniref:Uncharacterized protein n=1 Tax=Chelonoidis abingdonii TaxID=106734 RepID=A0A8C0J2C9_CHEAB